MLLTSSYIRVWYLKHVNQQNKTDTSIYTLSVKRTEAMREHEIVQANLGGDLV